MSEESLLDWYKASIDATSKLLDAKAKYNQACLDMIHESMQMAGESLRLNELRKAFKEFNIALSRRKREQKQLESYKKRFSHALVVSSQLITGLLTSKEIKSAWYSFFQLVELTDIDVKTSVSKVQFNNIYALSYFKSHMELPIAGSPEWLALCEMFDRIDNYGKAKVELINSEIKEIEQKIAELRDKRFSEVSKIGIPK